MSTTLLQISLDEEGKVTSYTNIAEPLTASQLMQIFPDLLKLYPGLRHGTLPYEGPHPELVQKLIDWRRERSREQGVSAYIVLTQKTLYAIADAWPQTEGELRNIPGFGERKFEEYGMDILRITCE